MNEDRKEVKDGQIEVVYGTIERTRKRMKRLTGKLEQSIKEQLKIP